MSDTIRKVGNQEATIEPLSLTYWFDEPESGYTFETLLK